MNYDGPRYSHSAAKDRIKALEAERDTLSARVRELEAGLRMVVDAKALSGVRSMVAGWNGEDRPEDKRYGRHPAQLEARIETRCGAVYDLDTALVVARALLPNPSGDRK